ALGLVVYANSLENGFTLDDFPIVVNNPLVQTLDLGRHMSSGYWPDRPEFGLYRPLTVFSYAVNRWVTGMAPTGYHAANLALHLLNGALAFLIALRILGSATAAGLTATAFLLHPVQTEAVNGVVGRAELLVAAFCLLAVLGYHQATSDRVHIRAGPCVTSVCASLLACFAKEQGVVLLGILVACDVMGRLRCRETVPILGSLVSNWRRYVPYAGVVILYLAVRLAAIGSILLPERPSLVDNPLAHLPVGQRVATAVAVLGKYGRLLLLPHPLSADYSYNQIEAVSSVFDPRLWTGLVVLALCALPIVQGLRRRWAPEWGFAVALSAVMLLPAANLLFPIGTAMAERLLYLPCLGFCLLLGRAFRELTRWRALNWILPLVASLLLVVYGLSTRIRNVDWRDNLTLFSSAARAAPRSAKVRLNLGNELHDRGDLDGELHQYREALRIYPEYVEVHSNMGLAYLALGQPDRALQACLRAIDLHAERSSLWANLGILLVRIRRVGSAAEAFQRALALDPGNQKALYNYGLACQELGRHEEAARAYLKILEFEPGNVDVAINLGELYNETGYTAETIAVYRRALQHNPLAYRVAYNLAVHLERMERDAEAADVFRQAAGAGDERGDFSLYKAGEIYHRIGRPAESAAALTAFLERWKGDPRYRLRAESLLRDASAPGGN
ncbi:MAG: tetratricopeptide repeat protein, partial [Candidatus Latescibacteria bacterium]|nr:tetratricopeptide repeat protein [Candidatus Latescibacterota bacterium]